MLRQQESNSVVYRNSKLLSVHASAVVLLTIHKSCLKLILYGHEHRKSNTCSVFVLGIGSLNPCHFSGVQGLLLLAVCNYRSVTQPLQLTGTCLVLDKLPCWFRFYAKCMNVQCLMGGLDSLLVLPNNVYLTQCLNKLLNVDSCFQNPLRVSWIEDLANHLSLNSHSVRKILDWAFI